MRTAARMIFHKRWLNCGAITFLSASCAFASASGRAQSFPLRDPAGLIAPDLKAQAVTYRGRKSVRITMDGEDHAGIALLPGVDFQDGVIEADIALKITTPPGVRYPGFVGIAFRARPDASHYELFYLRPGNSDAPDQAMRNHSVQYTSEPGFGWYRLRREWPFHLRISCGSGDGDLDKGSDRSGRPRRETLPERID